MGNIKEKLTSEEALQTIPICNNCKNYIEGLKCKAFDIIPDVILFGENNHSKVLKGQLNDFIFTPKS